MHSTDSSPVLPMRRSAACPGLREHVEHQPGPASREVNLCEIFRDAGGLATADEVAMFLSEQLDQPISRVAHWIVRREVILLKDAGQWFLPLFQFDLQAGGIRAEVAAALDELRPLLDDHEIASWFAVRLRGVPA